MHKDAVGEAVFAPGVEEDRVAGICLGLELQPLDAGVVVLDGDGVVVAVALVGQVDAGPGIGDAVMALALGDRQHQVTDVVRR